MAPSLNLVPILNRVGLVVQTAPVFFRRYLWRLIPVSPSCLSIFYKGVLLFGLNFFLWLCKLITSPTLAPMLLASQQFLPALSIAANDRLCLAQRCSESDWKCFSWRDDLKTLTSGLTKTSNLSGKTLRIRIWMILA